MFAELDKTAKPTLNHAFAIFISLFVLEMSLDSIYGKMIENHTCTKRADWIFYSLYFWGVS